MGTGAVAAGPASAPNPYSESNHQILVTEAPKAEPSRDPIDNPVEFTPSYLKTEVDAILHGTDTKGSAPAKPAAERYSCRTG